MLRPCPAGASRFTKARCASRQAPAMQQGVPMQAGLQDSYLAERPWAQALMGLQEGVLQQVTSQLEPLQLQPTRYSDRGVLSVRSLDGKSEFQTTTLSGQVVRHMYQTCDVMAPFDILHSKTGAHACMEQGTPFLDIEIVGNERSVLLAMFLTPRLSTLWHKAYVDKYYRSLPNTGSGAAGAAQGLLTFAQLYARMLARVQQPAAAGVAIISNTEGKVGGGSSEGKVYTHFHSRQLFVRMLAGHGMLFSFNPTCETALAAVRADITALVGLWCAWVKADAAQPSLEGPLLQECREMTRIMANSADQDEDSQDAERLLGSEGTAKLKETASGAASLAGTPWWSS